MSDACVTDSFARAKEAWSGSIRSPYPDGGASSGSYPPVQSLRHGRGRCQPRRASTDFNAEKAAGSTLSDARQLKCPGPCSPSVIPSEVELRRPARWSAGRKVRPAKICAPGISTRQASGNATSGFQWLPDHHGTPRWLALRLHSWQKPDGIAATPKSSALCHKQTFLCGLNTTCERGSSWMRPL